MSEWQPITTAPEGETILLFDEEWEATLGEIQIGHKNDLGEFFVDACPDFNPTHWMRLPNPPEAAE